jgi:hypothetical protein
VLFRSGPLLKNGANILGMSAKGEKSFRPMSDIGELVKGRLMATHNDRADYRPPIEVGDSPPYEFYAEFPAFYDSILCSNCFNSRSKSLSNSRS